MPIGSDRQLELMEAHIRRLTREIEELRGSTSWRITAPIRAARAMAQQTLSKRLSGRGKGRPRSSAPRAQVFSFGPSPVEIPPGSHYDAIYVIGCIEGESKRYRVYNLIDEMRLSGLRVVAVLEVDLDALTAIEVASKVVVLFRCPWSSHISRFMEYSRSRGAKTVFDVDDLIFEPSVVSNVRAVENWDAKQLSQYEKDIHLYRKTLLSCDMATVPTTYLKERANRLGAVAHVVPNTLNRLQLSLSDTLPTSSDTDEFRVGYFSGSATHQRDFAECEPALLTFMKATPEAKFVLAGHLELDGKWEAVADRIERHAFMPYPDMLKLLSTVHVNLAPLEVGNEFCEGKSQLKIFEAGAVGVPTIASETVSYKEAITHGVDGLLALTSLDWQSALSTLHAEKAKRRALGSAARLRAGQQWGPPQLLEAARAAYLDEPPLPRQSPTPSKPEGRLRIAWLLPGLILGSGGHRNILRAAYHLAQFGHEVTVFVTDTDKSSADLDSLIRKNFYDIDGDIRRYEQYIPQVDVLFATHWPTVEIAMRHAHSAGKIMYFVQDFEPLFYPMGTQYIKSENTYKYGLFHICSGPWCAKLLSRDYGAATGYFQFPIEKSTYYADERASPANSIDGHILFFAKPEMPRRCFELGLEALELVKIIKPTVKITLFGSEAIKNLRLPFACELLGLTPTINDLADLYRNADLGLVFSTTNPSLVPYEMMACGLPVIDLDRGDAAVNYDERRDLALLANPEPRMMAQQIVQLLDAPEERRARAQRGLEFVQTFPTEDAMAKRIEELILSQFVGDPRLS